jgi:hypothetical protein
MVKKGKRFRSTGLRRGVARTELMTDIEEIKTGQSLTGLEPGHVASVLASNPIGLDAVQVVY